MATFLGLHHAGTMRPTKEQIRRSMDERRQSLSPPPPTTEIRHQLGWAVFHRAKRLVR